MLNVLSLPLVNPDNMSTTNMTYGLMFVMSSEQRVRWMFEILTQVNEIEERPSLAEALNLVETWLADPDYESIQDVKDFYRKYSLITHDQSIGLACKMVRLAAQEDTADEEDEAILEIINASANILKQSRHHSCDRWTLFDTFNKMGYALLEVQQKGDHKQ